MLQRSILTTVQKQIKVGQGLMHPNPLLFLFLVFVGLHQHLIKFQTQLQAWDLPTGCSRSGCKTWDASTPGFSCSSSTDTAFPLTLHGQQLVAFSTQRWHRMPLTLPVPRLFPASQALRAVCSRRGSRYQQFARLSRTVGIEFHCWLPRLSWMEKCSGLSGFRQE